MALNLSKGENVSLTKDKPGLKAVMVGLGWDARATDGADFDLDAGAFILGSNGKVRSEDDFIYHNNLKSNDGNVAHQGDNRTGEGEGDDEQILVNLASLPEDVDKIVVAVNVFKGANRGQNFGQISNAYVRILNVENNEEIAKFDLTEDSATQTIMTFCEIYRKNGEWKMKAIGQGSTGDFSTLTTQYGL